MSDHSTAEWGAPVKLPPNIEGAEKIARYWIYDHAGETIPQREAEAIARALIDFMRLVVVQEQA